MQEELSNISNEFFTRLDFLADKLGVTTEYLWPIFIKKELIHGYTNFILFLSFFLISTFILVLHSRVKFSRYTKEDMSVGRCEPWEIGKLKETNQNQKQLITTVKLTVISIITLFLFLGTLSSSLEKMFTPEAAVIENLLQAF